ncbi:MAG: efflux RND transporter periplasmic adaptor subunit [Campylobacterota bacterium]|nr:efflux RND transporter periplasmic adaptor subunit [Campylobacterota bacterium]
MTIEDKLDLNKPKTDKKYFFIILILTAVSAVIYILYFYKIENNSDAKMEYITKEVKKEKLSVIVSATGNLEPTNSVDIGIEVSGTIKEIYVDYNDNVKVGQLMAKLDTNKLENEVASNKASLLMAKANLYESEITVKNKKSKLDRALKIYRQADHKFPSDEDIENYKYEYELSQATFKVNQAKQQQAFYNLKTSQENLLKATVKSSIDGIILSRNVEIGQTVAATMQTPILFKLARDLSRMELIVSIDEADIADIKEGLDVTFSVDAYLERKFKGVLKQLRLNPKEVNAVITYDAVVSVDNDELLLKPGMTATAQITTKVINNTLIIPNGALRFKPIIKKEKKASLTFSREIRKRDTKDLDKIDKRDIWILKGSEAKKVSVKVLASDGKNSAVESDEIKENDLVIISQKNSNE